jgi:hypothetical protein
MGQAGGRVNTISLGIIFTPLSKDDLSPVVRGGTPDEVRALELS